MNRSFGVFDAFVNLFNKAGAYWVTIIKMVKCILNYSNSSNSSINKNNDNNNNNNETATMTKYQEGSLILMLQIDLCRLIHLYAEIKLRGSCVGFYSHLYENVIRCL